MTSEEDSQNIQLNISHVLGSILQNIPVKFNIAPHASTFQLVPFEEDDGSESIAVALGLSAENGLDVYWFRAEDLEIFIGSAIQAHQAVTGAINKLHPLQVANNAIMQQTINQKNIIDGKLILGGK